MHSTITRRKQVRDETFKLLTENGLSGWKVRFNPRLSRALGRCIPSQKTIEYQPRYMEQNDWEQVVMTIRHEVAHALSPVWAGHNAVWQRKCLELGGDGKRTNSTATLRKRFTGTCPGCGGKTERDRRNTNACSKCCREHNNGVFSSQYRFVWTRNN